MQSIVVMGVGGCGKSSLGAALADALGWPLIEGDDFHPPANIEKMRAGRPLDDDDRACWLAALGEQLRRHPHGAVLTCSALKRRYRDTLRAAAPGLRFAHLVLTPEAARTRVAARPGHPFPPSLVDSQFEALEPPDNEPGVLSLDAMQPLDVLRQTTLDWLAAGDEETTA